MIPLGFNPELIEYKKFKEAAARTPFAADRNRADFRARGRASSLLQEPLRLEEVGIFQ